MQHEKGNIKSERETKKQRETETNSVREREKK